MLGVATRQPLYIPDILLNREDVAGSLLLFRYIVVV